MKKLLLTVLASLCIVLALTACGTESNNQIQYRFADKAEGQELLLSNTEYYDGFTENDLQFRMQRKDATMEKYLTFAKAQVMDFRADMYQLIHFTVQEEEYQVPPSVLEYYISNPDVEHHNAWATFEINGEPTDCYLAFATRKHFRKKGDMFFDTGTAVLVPVDGSDQYYYPEDAANYYEVLGENTGYTIDPEECMADNFGYLMAYDAEGPEGKGYKTPEIIDGIRDYLQKE